MQQIDFRAMGCQMMAAVDSESAEARHALDSVPIWFEEWEQVLSRFRANSELSQANRNSGNWVTVSQTLWDVFQLGRIAAEKSDGLVNPTMLQALEAAGYDRSFELVQTSFATISLGRSVTADWRDIAIDAEKRAVKLPPGLRMDLGGVAKGWAADDTSIVLFRYAISY